jgi:hypothetical protein
MGKLSGSSYIQMYIWYMSSIYDNDEKEDLLVILVIVNAKIGEIF